MSARPSKAESARRRASICAMFRRGVPVPDIASEFSVRGPAIWSMLRRAGEVAPYNARAGKPGTKSPEARAKIEAQKDSLAEFVANGGGIAAWGRENGVGEGMSFNLWAKIRAGLGPQAA